MVFRRITCRRGLPSGSLLFVALLLPSVLVFFIMILIPGADETTSEQEALDSRMYDIQAEMDHLRMLDKQKQKAYFDLQGQFMQVVQNAERLQHRLSLGQNSSQLVHGADLANRAAGLLLTNVSQMASTLLAIPNLYDHLPHLLSLPLAEALNPALLVAAGVEETKKMDQRLTSTHFIIGIPTVKRPKTNYLLTTLHSIIDNLSVQERQQVTIVVFIGELGLTTYAQEQVNSLSSEFREYIDSGLIELLVPPAHFYPDFETIIPTFNDNHDRMKWRTKQNLDYAYLMMYCQNKATYYLQLEDDIITKPSYLGHIKNFIAKQTTVNNNWFLLEFSSLGFIGKLFKTHDLPNLINFLLLFYREKPVDWLLDHILYVKVCHPEKNPKQCQVVKNKFRIRRKPSLFQHIGVHSSLAGKTQKLKERDFGKPTMHRAHTDNPTAKVSTSLKVYQKYGIQNAYDGDSFFWALLPQPGDWIKIELTPPVRIESILFVSGNHEHTDDRFYNTTVEVLGSKNDQSLTQRDFERTDDKFAVVAQFQNSGRAEVSLNTTEPVECIRVVVHSESAYWIIMSEMQVKSLQIDAPIQTVPGRRTLKSMLSNWTTSFIGGEMMR